MQPYQKPAPAIRPPDLRGDGDLIQRICQRDEAALLDAYQRYHRLAALVARRITRDEPTVEEVVQDVFQAVWRSADRFEAGSSLAAWIVGIARFCALNAVRSKSYRARRHEERLSDPAVAAAIRGIGDIEDVLVLRESLRASLASLPAPQREALELAFFSQLSLSEIAAQLGSSISIVRRRLRRGLLRLRHQFAADPGAAAAEPAELDDPAELDEFTFEAVRQFALRQAPGPAKEAA